MINKAFVALPQRGRAAVTVSTKKAGRESNPRPAMDLLVNYLMALLNGHNRRRNSAAVRGGGAPPDDVLKDCEGSSASNSRTDRLLYAHK